jgi:ectoine hydroxylase-related dioxygenase (phytanoyl-CoA dioxygenase family)
MVINVPLVTMEKENGSTEVWLGTHHETTIADQEGAHGDRASGRIKKHLLEARKEICPPSQPLVKKGSMIVRDLRLWHGGKPNFSNDPRVMLALSEFFSFRKNFSTLTACSSLRTLVSQSDASRNCRGSPRSAEPGKDRLTDRCDIRAD